MVEVRMAGSQKCLSLRSLGYTTIFVQILICLLFVYALMVEAGNLLVDGCKKIGFYNYCIQNTTNVEDCHCATEFDDLHPTVAPHGLIASLLLAYSSLVLVTMCLITLVLAQGLKDGILWKFNLGLNVLSLVGLFLGMTTHLFLTRGQFDFFHVTPGFLALLLALVGLSFQCFLINHYIRLGSVWSTSKTAGQAAEDLSSLVA